MNANTDFMTALVAVIGIVGVVIGVTLEFIFSKKREVSGHYMNLRSQAYVDFIKSVSGIAQANRQKDRGKEQESIILLTDSKARIAVHGSKEVVEAMADFFRLYGILNSEEAITSFINVIQKMRIETGAEEVGDTEISDLLFR